VAASVQMSLAAWRTLHSGKTLLAALSALSGPSGLRTTASQAEALSRLFAMKGLLDGEGAAVVNRP